MDPLNRGIFQFLSSNNLKNGSVVVMLGFVRPVGRPSKDVAAAAAVAAEEEQ